mgnify:CR=1 FL=1
MNQLRTFQVYEGSNEEIREKAFPASHFKTDFTQETA